VKVTQTGDQTITTGTWTKINYNNEYWDTDGFHDNVTNNSRLTIPAGLGGLYHFIAQITMAANATGVRFAAITINGATPSADPSFEHNLPAFATYTTRLQVSGFHVLNAADYIEAWVYQTSGGNLATAHANGWFGLFRVGS
jgi:hypothetical protein